MDNIKYDVIKFDFNGESYEINQKKDLSNGLISYFLPLTGIEDFNKLVDLINVYNPITSILHNPWKDDYEELLICDRHIDKDNIDVNYRIICELQTAFITINFKTNGLKENEEYVRQYVCMLVREVLEKKKDLNDENKVMY